MVSLKMLLPALLTLYLTIVEPTDDSLSFQKTYKKVGILNTTIASSFDILSGEFSLIRCINKCAQAGCPLVAWGYSSAGLGECRALLQNSFPDTATPLPLNSISGPFSLYVPVGSNLTLHQYTFAILLLTETKVSWFDYRAFCRNYGFEMFTPSLAAEVEALRIDFPMATWTGANDLVSEGTWVMDDGSPFPMALFANSEPNNLNNQDCGVLRNQLPPPGAYDDGSCEGLNDGFCTVGQ